MSCQQLPYGHGSQLSVSSSCPPNCRPPRLPHHCCRTPACCPNQSSRLSLLPPHAAPPRAWRTRLPRHKPCQSGYRSWLLKHSWNNDVQFHTETETYSWCCMAYILVLCFSPINHGIHWRKIWLHRKAKYCMLYQNHPRLHITHTTLDLITKAAALKCKSNTPNLIKMRPDK